MSSAAGSVPRRVPEPGLGAEWERLALLGRLLADSRQGRDPEAASLEELRALQERVDGLRAEGGPWHRALSGAGVRGVGLSSLELDLLACVVAPEAEPRLGWVYQNLQPGSPQPWATAALIQELLALDAALTRELFAALDEGGSLRRSRLIELAGSDPFQAIRPAPGLADALIGRARPAVAPPASTPVELRPSWEDLVLPEDRFAMLREFLLWIEHREKVTGEWGGVDYGGPVALFAGPSGTGKTFAAAVLAAEIGWPLYRVDLGRLVSKYIGETEKNLNRLFDAAHGREMVLQFDEADSLFSKRGEVKEARDRYANMEVSHLLARIESHRGPCILTTNLRSNLDPAFARRFQLVVDFPRPDAAARRRLWQRLLPPRAPREADLDVAFLGSAVNLTGGGIRNAALHAAFLAACREKAIGLEEVTLAVWRELSKDGRDLSLSDLGALAEHFPEGGVLC